MNTRDYKQNGIGEFYHIYNRGNSKNLIFIDDEDRRFFLLRLSQNLFPEKWSKNRYNRIQPLPPNSFSILSYCLMPNHFHLLIRQDANLPPGKLILKLCTSYSKYFNKRHDHVGHVFQDRFRQALIDNNEYLIWLAAYIHQNPKVAGITKNLSEYRWSSYPAYLGNTKNDLCDKSLIEDQFKTTKQLIDFTESAYNIMRSKRELDQFLLDD